MIPLALRNLANDPEINGMIPSAFPALEVVAGATKSARDLAGNDEPDRHAFLKALPAYLNALPKSVPLALEIIHLDASAVLGIPGLAKDHKTLSAAQAKLSEAESAVAEAEALQGRRLARITALEQDITECQRETEAWEIDFESETESAERRILDYWGKAQVREPFDTIASLQILRKLAPVALEALSSRKAAAEKELSDLQSK